MFINDHSMAFDMSMRANFAEVGEENKSVGNLLRRSRIGSKVSYISTIEDPQARK